MTKISKADNVAAMIAAIEVLRDKVKSDKNKISANNAIAKLKVARIADLMHKQNVSASDLTDLYETQRVIRFCDEITQDAFDVAKCDENMTCVVKTVINAANVDATVTRADIVDSLIATNSNARAHVYQRKAKISADRQVQMTFSAIKILNLVDRATLKARDCEALKIAKAKLENIAL